MTNSQRQQRLELLIHDLGPNGTARFIALIGMPSFDTEFSPRNLPRFQALFRSSFISMIGNGSFGQSEAASRMKSLASQKPSQTAWFTTNLLGSIPATSNSNAVKLSAAQELITLGLANSKERQDDYAQAADLLGTVGQEGGTSSAQQVLNILGNYSQQHPNFMFTFAQDATQGMMNLSPPGTMNLAKPQYGTAFPGMASLLNALINMNDAASSTGQTAKQLAIKAFGGITQVIQNQPSQVSALLTEERVLGNNGLRVALANTFGKYAPECFQQWGNATNAEMNVMNVCAKTGLGTFMGFELSPIGDATAARTALNTIMKGAVGRFMNYAYSRGANGDASMNQLMGCGLTRANKTYDASGYVGAILGAILAVANTSEARALSPTGTLKTGQLVPQAVVDFTGILQQAMNVAEDLAPVASGPEDPGSWLAITKIIQDVWSLTGSASKLSHELEGAQNNGAVISSVLQKEFNGPIVTTISNVETLFMRTLEKVLTNNGANGPKSNLDGWLSEFSDSNNAAIYTTTNDVLWLPQMYAGWSIANQTVPLTELYGWYSSYYVGLEVDGLNGEEKRSSITDPTGSINQS
jgi:hypothetical protein